MKCLTAVCEYRQTWVRGTVLCQPLSMLMCGPPLLQVETRITCPLSAVQTFWYRRLLLKDSSLLIKLENEDQSIKVRSRLKVQRCRLVSCQWPV
jgi:hypothetical protein